AHKRCDLAAGTYAYEKARAHGCLSEGALTPGVGAPACSLLDFPGLSSGFSSKQEDDGYADYVTSNAGSCIPDPRLEPYRVEPRPDSSPTTVSYLSLSGTTTYTDKDSGWKLRYPRRFHARRIAETGFDYGRNGIEIANFKPTKDDSQRRVTA